MSTDPAAMNEVRHRYGDTRWALCVLRQISDALAAIHQLVQDESQFIIATHSPILLAYPNAKILQFDASGIYEVAFEDTEHYAVTRDFLNHYPRRLEQLLGDDEDGLAATFEDYRL